MNKSTLLQSVGYLLLCVSLLLTGCEGKLPGNINQQLVEPPNNLSTPLPRLHIPIEKKITFIHTGDFHGDLVPHQNPRNNSLMLEGGLARVATVVGKIRKNSAQSIHVHTGDTIAGSAEATFTRGDALVRIVDQLDIDVFAPGNWEFSFGIYRFLQYFGSADDIVPYTAEDEAQMVIAIPAAEQGIIPTYGHVFQSDKRWGAISANAYFNGKRTDPGVNNRGAGERLMAPYKVMEKNGVRIGFIGCTTNRGPQIVSSNITTGISFTNCKGEVKFPQNKAIAWPAAGHINKGIEDPALVGVPPAEGGDAGFQTVSEIEKYVKILRTPLGQPVEGEPAAVLGEGVEIVAVLSEAGIAENIFNGENVNGVDIYFSSDMHETSTLPVVVTAPDGKKVIIVEQGEDGTQVGELEVNVINGKITEWEWTAHTIDERINENIAIKTLIHETTKSLYQTNFVPGAFDNPYNQSKLMRPLDTVIGFTAINIERNRFSHEWNPALKIMPAVIEGTGHALITDAFRKLTNAQVGGIRGFRYGNTIARNSAVTLGDLYHFFPIGAMIAKANIPTTPSSELPFDQLSTIVDTDGDGRTIKDNKENPRHYLGWPRNLLQEIELSGNSTMNPIIFKWGGGWVFNYSGIKFDFFPAGKNFNKYGIHDSTRIGNFSFSDGTPVPTALGSTISYASYYYDTDANRINRNKIVGQNNRELVADKIMILSHDIDKQFVMVSPLQYNIGTNAVPPTLFPLDAVDALSRYISDVNIDVFQWDDVNNRRGTILHTAVGLNSTISFNDFVFPRINLVNAAGISENTLVDGRIEFGFPVIEPLRGAEPALLNGNVTLPPGYIKGIAEFPINEGFFP